MAPPALNLTNASFKGLNAFSTATTPLRNSFTLSCRSPITPSHRSGPTPSPSRHGTYLEPPTTPYAAPGSRCSPSRLGDKGDYEYGYDDDDASTEDGSPTDQTWFLPRSPGLPPASLLRPGNDGKLGVLSSINIIVGKTMGVGAYSVPSAIFSGVGSVGMTLLMWIVGSLISFCGLAVYLDLGTAIPRSGGERVYLERIFRRPYMLATCMFMAYVVLLGFSTPNAIVLGEHALYVTGAAENQWNVRLIAVASVTALCYVHARHPRVGLALINTLGVAKILILVVVVVSGVAGGLMGVGAEREALLLDGRRVDLAMAGDAPSSTAQRNFHAIWEGSSTQPYDYATALLKVVYCFRGYSTANQVLSDVRNPVRTLQIAAPVALTLVSIAYLAINIAFFLVVDKDEFRSAGVVVAGVFFRKVFGDGLGTHILPLFVVVSAAGNIAATSFAQARVNEELAREGVLPAFWMSGSDTTTKTTSDRLVGSGAGAGAGARSSSPSKSRVRRMTTTTTTTTTSASSITPSRGLLLHWLVSVAAIVLPPPGKIFNFLVDIGGYPVSVISVAVSLGLLYLHVTPSERWITPYRAPRLAILVFAASNCLLLVLPWIPPRDGMAEDNRFPSFAYPATSLGVLTLGVLYWFVWRLRGGNAAAAAAAAAGRRRTDREDEKMRSRITGRSAGSARPRPASCCALEDNNNSEDEDEGGDDANSEDTVVVAEEEQEQQGQEAARHKSAGSPVPIVNNISGGGGRGPQTCGCRACPTVRRRGLCGCPSCPTRLQSR